MKKVSLICFFILLSLNAKAEIIGTWPCGADCTATLDSEGNFLVTGSGKMTDYQYIKDENNEYHSLSPWDSYRSQIKSVEVEGVTNIGSAAFYLSNVSKLKIGESVTSVGQAAFEGNKIKSVELADSIRSISSYSFVSGLSSASIIIPDTIDSIGFNSLGWYDWAINQNKNIICRGNNCERVSDLLKNYGCRKGDERLTVDVSNKMSLAGENQCNSEKYYWTGGMCSNRPTDGSAIECDEGWYATNKDVCARIKLRYTLPEADAATSNDNENMIEWIFE